MIIIGRVTTIIVLMMTRLWSDLATHRRRFVLAKGRGFCAGFCARL